MTVAMRVALIHAFLIRTGRLCLRGVVRSIISHIIREGGVHLERALDREGGDAKDLLQVDL